MKKSFIFMLTVLLLTSLLFSACAPNKNDDVQESNTEKTFKIGINNFGQANFFARIGKKSMEEQIKKNGGEVISTVTADVPSRISAIEDLISQGVDAIIVQEGDIEQAAPALIEAKNQGIIIASMASGDAEFVDVYVASDEALLGQQSAEKLVELMGNEGNIVEIYNDAGSMIRIRRQALHDVVENYPNIKIPFGFVYAWPDFFPDVKSKMEVLIQANPEPGQISGVFATFDGGGVAASTAIREAGLQDNIIVVGIDGDPEAYREMKLTDSPFKATMAQDPDTIARLCVDKVFELLNGNELAERVFNVPGILITKDNIPEGE